MKRVLILMSKTGGGHLASAQAIQDIFAAQYGEAVEATIVDLLMDYLPWPMREAPKAMVGLPTVRLGYGVRFIAQGIPRGWPIRLLGPQCVSQHRPLWNCL